MFSEFVFLMGPLLTLQGGSAACSVLTPDHLLLSTPVNSYPDNSDLRLIRTSLRLPFQDDQCKIILLIRISRYS